MNNEQSKYAGLKPGQYLQIGDTIKNVTDFNQLIMGNSGKTPAAEVLAARVAWVYIALDKRRNQVQQTPVSWHRGENELDDIQLDYDPLTELPRSDKAIQLLSVAYLHKLRNASKKMVGLRWLDPALMTPDDRTVDMDGYTQYFRNIDGRRIPIPADDVIRVYIPGLRELAPDTPASLAASLDSQIALEMNKTLDGFFETGGLPVLFIDIPGNPQPQQVGNLVDKWKRILRREGDGQNKMIATTGGITVTPISLSPDQLDTTNISESNAAAITATYGVPYPLAMGQAVNETTLVKLSEIFAGDILGRVNLIISQINSDPDVAKSGYSLAAHPERMEVFQRAELAKAEALQRLVQYPIMTPNEARMKLELEPLPDGDELAKPQQGQTFGQLAQPTADTPDPTPSKAHDIEYKALRNYVRNGKHRKRAFNANEVTREQIAMTIQELDPDWALAMTQAS